MSLTTVFVNRKKLPEAPSLAVWPETWLTLIMLRLAYVASLQNFSCYRDVIRVYVIAKK